MKLRSAGLTVAVAIFSISGFAPSYANAQTPGNSKISIVVTQTPQPDAPLRIVELTQNSFDALSVVTFQNYSDKAVVSFQIGWTTMVPDGCANKGSEPAVFMGPVDQANIKPGESWKTGSYRLWTSDLASSASARSASLLYVQVGVVAVTFSDGSHWNFNLSQRKIFDQGAVDFQSHRCTSGTLAQACPTAVGEGDFKLAFLQNPSPDITFHCVGSLFLTSCQADETTCTVKVCKNKDSCPEQACQIN